MKQAIAYIRISDKDQSNFSLTGQEKCIRDHCTENKYNLLAVFIDDGKSAKNFDRPDWHRLEDFIKNHKNVDYLIVVKYDRFSRNAAQGLQKIEWLEKKYNIIIISVFERMYIDYDSPFFFKQRADILVNAEFEWHVIRDRTRFGMHQALLSGRYISKAPIGYLNTRDENKKPIIVIDEQKTEAIKNIFAQYLNGVPFLHIRKIANEQGISLKGRSCVPRILKNCVYGGLVYVPAYRKDVPKYVKGLHQGIVSEDLWWKVQNRMGNVPRVKLILNDAVPLRGILRDSCGKFFTAGQSKGKLKYYWYYKCNDHPKHNYSAVKLHAQLDEILNYFSFNKLQLQYLRMHAEKEMRMRLKDRVKVQQQTERDWKGVLVQLESLEEKFINNQVNHSTYQKWYNTFKAKEVSLRFSLEQLSGATEDKWKKFEQGLPLLQDVKFLYHKAELTQKHSFLNAVFNSQLSYEGESYRTPYLIEFFRHNALILKEKRLLIWQPEVVNLPENSECAPEVTIVEHLANFFNIIQSIKIA